VEVNSKKTADIFMSYYQNVGQNYKIKTTNKSLKNVAKFKYLQTIIAYQIYIYE